MPDLLRLARAMLSLTLLWGLITACSVESEPPRYEFAVKSNGGPSGWPVWVEELTFDDAWRAPAGSLSGGFDIRPPRGRKTVTLSRPMPAPSSLQARWFSYRTQTFYEIDLELPETGKLLRQWYRDYPASRYLHSLIAGFSGQGEVFVWWHAWCRDCGNDRSQDLHAPIVESAHANEAQGEPAWYYEQTQQYIDEDVIPSPW
ncbi:DUF2931 family protein [Halomonas sp. M4R5S39]|uniref:DUF2931 family protein n=1 Tax=Halomonas kalidii TaxID=3043293 RepID=UPI0024A81646|nr:DUF2931 family protein [Halomonas kalidii]MDI5985697.1 DUF2931 family protein [Halomonas kalidii]